MVKVYDTTNPKRDAWDMSEEGFEELNRKFPGRYAKRELPKVITVPQVEKKSVVVNRVTPTPHKKSTGKS